MEHSPGKFIVVAQHETGVLLHAMCECGDDDCGFTLFANMKDAVRLFKNRDEEARIKWEKMSDKELESASNLWWLGGHVR